MAVDKTPNRVWIQVKDARTLRQISRIITLLIEAERIAAHKGAEEIKNRAQEILSALEHPAETRTPSPPGAPPAMITGQLRESIMVSDLGKGSQVGPTALASSTNGPYGRFLELGGKHEGNMHWREDGQWHSARILMKLPRPYMKPARDSSLEEIRHIVAREVRDAIRMGLRG